MFKWPINMTMTGWKMALNLVRILSVIGILWMIFSLMLLKMALWCSLQLWCLFCSFPYCCHFCSTSLGINYSFLVFPLEEFTLKSGHTIPAGAGLVVPIELVMMDDSTWGGDSSEFDPYRFLSKAGEGSDTLLRKSFSGFISYLFQCQLSLFSLQAPYGAFPSAVVLEVLINYQWWISHSLFKKFFKKFYTCTPFLYLMFLTCAWKGSASALPLIINCS